MEIKLNFSQIEKTDKTKREFVCVAATDKVITHMIGGEPVNLQIDIDSLDLSRFASGKAPLLFDHDSNKRRVGVVKSARVEGGKLLAECLLSQTGLGKDLIEDINDGIYSEFSVGLMFTADSLVYRDDLDLYVIRNATPYELSITNVAPANDDCVLVGLFSRSTGVTKMEKNETKKDIDLNVELAKERERIAGITELAKKFGVDSKDAIESGMSVEAFGLELAKTYEPPKAEKKAPEAPAVIIDTKPDTEEAVAATFNLDNLLNQMYTGKTGAELELAHYTASKAGINGVLVPMTALFAMTSAGSTGMADTRRVNPDWPITANGILANLPNTKYTSTEYINIPVVGEVGGGYDLAEGQSTTDGASEVPGLVLQGTNRVWAHANVPARMMMHGGAGDIVRQQILEAIGKYADLAAMSKVDAKATVPAAGPVTHADLVDIYLADTEGFVWVVGSAAARKLATTKLDNGSGRFLFENGKILGMPTIVSDRAGADRIYGFRKPSSLHTATFGGLLLEDDKDLSSQTVSIVGTLYFDAVLSRGADVKILVHDLQ